MKMTITALILALVGACYCLFANTTPMGGKMGEAAKEYQNRNAAATQMLENALAGTK